MKNIKKSIIGLFTRKADVSIGGEKDPYMLRWWIIPRNPLFNIYLHKFLRDDDDRALHDHPWASVSIVVSGKLKEYLFMWPGHNLMTYPVVRRTGSITIRLPRHAHRIALFRDRANKPIPAWTIFITGPRVRQWGFHCPNGWKHWRHFTAENDSTIIGAGCD